MDGSEEEEVIDEGIGKSEMEELVENEVGKKIKGVDSRDMVKHTKKSDQLFLVRTMKVAK